MWRVRPDHTEGFIGNRNLLSKSFRDFPFFWKASFLRGEKNYVIIKRGVEMSTFFLLVLVTELIILVLSL